MKQGIEQFRRAKAKELRGRETTAEQKLWRALDRVPLHGTHFRRQVPIGNYIADFACLSAKLIIELDGGHHANDMQAAHDTQRTAWLEKEGYRIIRFWNTEIESEIESVLDTIYAELYGSAHAEQKSFTPPRTALRSDPPPQGEGG